MRAPAARLLRPLGQLEGLLLALAVSLPAAAFLLLPGFLVSSDGYYHLHRIVALDSELRAGQWPVRWAQDLYFGYGYPLFNYYAPLTYWLGEGFHLAGLSFVNAFKAVSLLGVLLGASGAYLLVRRFATPLVAVAASALYVYAPFPLTDLYFRADLPEYVAIGLLPWACWAIPHGVERWRAVAPAGALLGGLILTHNGLAFIAAPFLGLFGLWYALAPAAGPPAIVPGVHPRLQHGLRWLPGLRAWGWAVPRLVRVALLGVFALGLSATFWLPALAERELVQFDRLLLIDYREQFVGLGDLLATDLIHRYIAVAVGTWHVFPYRLGLGQGSALAAGVGTLVWLVATRRKLTAGGRLALAFGVAGLAALVLTQPVTRPIWDSLPLLSHLQFPWRLLGIIALPAAVLGGFALSRLPARGQPVAAGLTILLVSVSALGGLRPVASDLGNQVATPAGSQWFEALYNTVGTTTRGEFLPVAVHEPAATSATMLTANLGDRPGWRPVPDLRLEPATAGSVTGAWQRHRLSADVTLTADATLKLPVAAFPAWQVAVNESFVEWQPSQSDGLIAVKLTPGQHRVVAYYDETPIQRAGNAISAIAALVLAATSVVGLATTGRRLAGANLDWASVLRPAALIAVGAIVALLIGRAARPPAELPRGEVIGELAGGQVHFAASLEPAPAGGPIRLAAPGDALTVEIQFAGGPGVAAALPIMAARLTNAGGETWSAVAVESADGLTKRQEIRIGADTPPGIYRVEVWLLDQAEPMVHTEIGRFRQASLLPIQNRIQLGPVGVLPGEPVEPGGPAIAAFVGGLRLSGLGLGTSRTAEPALVTELPGEGIVAYPDDDLIIRTQWLTTQPLPDDLRFSLHLLDGRNLLWAGRDAQPAAGLAPTSFWVANRPIGDLMRVRLPVDLPPGDYRLQLRVHRADGAAVSTLDAAGRPSLPQVVLGTVRVRPGDTIAAGPPDTVRALGPGLGFLEGAAGGSYRPGDRVEVSARFVGLGGAQDQAVELALLGPAGPVASVQVAPVGEAYPVGQWRPGEVLRGRHLVRVPVDAAPGEYRVRLRGEGNEEVFLGSITVQPAPPRREASPPAQRFDVPFGDVAVLLGADLPAQVAPGAELPARLVWRAARDGTEAYAVSVQLLDAENRLIAQHDGAPANGAAPTNQWREDETIEDPRTLRVPATTAPGRYRVVAILYDQATGRRIPTPGGDLAGLGVVEVR